MTEKEDKAEKLGKLISAHTVAPAYLQRAVIVAAFSFMFFLVTLVMFSMWRNFLYFFLSTAFLIVYLVTMFGWLMLRKNMLKIYENGVTYKKFTARWNEIEAVETSSENGKLICELRKAKGEKAVLSDTLYDIDNVVKIIRAKTNH